jgi:peptide/nickel transport system substrate-binding protein
MISGDPFTCTWLFTDFPRSDRVVLEANSDHWNKERGPRLAKVVYVNDIDPAEVLEKVCNTRGEIDIVSEVSPADARKVADSEHANLVTVDALRVVPGLINRNASLMDDIRIRRTLNLAVDRERLINEVFHGYAHPVAALAPPYSGGAPDGLEPYRHDPEEAKRLLSEVGWPEGRPSGSRPRATLRPSPNASPGTSASRSGSRSRRLPYPTRTSSSPRKHWWRRTCHCRSTFWSTPGST